MAIQKPTKTPAAPAEAKKAACPITREQFQANVKPILLVINGENKVASPKDFSTGSFGYFFNEKSTVIIDGVPCKVQWNCMGTLVGSKDLPK